ncbi:MAG: hypothetical protein OSA87_07625 [Woeseiaceae bacterium]|jgi:hypothetical protein|nr:hypothetical protein [Woeseiaceae bacterium]|tara:strand:- start:378 stop:539 length:162 start_codon:yes stop_codon:yes gene_type:complete
MELNEMDEEQDLEAEAGLLEHLDRVDQDITAIRQRTRELLDSLQSTEQKKDEE